VQKFTVLPGTVAVGLPKAFAAICRFAATEPAGL
jgi:hypothetical protein